MATYRAHGRATEEQVRESQASRLKISQKQASTASPVPTRRLRFIGAEAAEAAACLGKS